MILLQDFVRIQMIKETLMNDHTDGHRELLPASFLLGYLVFSGIFIVSGLFNHFKAILKYYILQKLF